MSEVTERWIWCMDWLRKRRLPPADSKCWERANRAFDDQYNSSPERSEDCRGGEVQK